MKLYNIDIITKKITFGTWGMGWYKIDSMLLWGPMRLSKHSLSKLIVTRISFP